MIKQRSFWFILFVGILTCGIYFFYWTYKTTDGINRMAGMDGKDTSPGLAVLFMILTGGLYLWWWYYKQGDRIQAMGHANNLPISESGVTYLLWYLIGVLVFGIGPFVAMYLLNRNYNTIVRAYHHAR